MMIAVVHLILFFLLCVFMKWKVSNGDTNLFDLHKRVDADIYSLFIEV